MKVTNGALGLAKQDLDVDTRLMGEANRDAVNGSETLAQQSATTARQYGCKSRTTERE
jgi:hypothetical protein